MALINLKGKRLGIVGTSPEDSFNADRCSMAHAGVQPARNEMVNRLKNSNATPDLEQLSAYNGAPQVGQSLSMEIEDNEYPGQPIIRVDARVVSDLQIRVEVSNHENSTNTRVDFGRLTNSDNWNKITIDGHSEFVPSELNPITPDAPLADFALALLTLNFALQNLSSKLGSTEFESMSRNARTSISPPERPNIDFVGTPGESSRNASPQHLSRTERRGVLRELGLLRTSRPGLSVWPDPNTDYPILAQTRGRAAGLPGGGAKAPTRREEDDCCIGQNLTCSFGNKLGKHTIKTGLCGSYKVDVLECCEKHDIQLFCGDGIDLPEPLSYVTALPEIELWLIATAMQLSLCVSSIITAKLTAEWPWYCGSFLIGLLVSAIIGAVVIVGTTVGLWIAPHDLVWGWFMGDPNIRNQIALDGDHNHCCLCGGNETTWCCNWKSSLNAKKCRDKSGNPRPLCW